MEYIRLYRAVSAIDYENLENFDVIKAFNTPSLFNNSDINTFNYKDASRIHFFLYPCDMRYYSELTTSFILLEFKIPLELCLNYLGVGKYQNSFFIEFGIPIDVLRSYIDDESFFSMTSLKYKRDYIYLNNKIKYKKIIKEEIKYNKPNSINEFASEIYKKAQDHDYKLIVPEKITKDFLESYGHIQTTEYNKKSQFNGIVHKLIRRKK